MAKAKMPQNLNNPRAAVINEGVGLFGRFFSRNKKAVEKLEQGVMAKSAGYAAHEAEHMAAQRMAAQSMPKQSRPGLFLSSATGLTAGIGGAHGFFSRINQYVFGVGMAAGALGAMGKLPVIGKAFSSTAVVISKPKDYLEKTTVSEFARVGSTALGKVHGVLHAKSPQSSLAANVGQVQGVFASAEEKLLQGMGKGVGRASAGLGDFVERNAGDTLKNIAARIGGRSAVHKEKAGGVLSHLLHQTEGHEGLSAVGKHFSAAKTALEAGDHDALQTALGSATTGLGSASGVDKKMLREMKKAVGEVGESAAEAAQKSGLAEKLTHLPDTIRNAPEAIGKSNLSNFALKGALVTGTALQITGTAKGIGEKIHVLKQVHSDLTGETRISTRKLMFGKNVPPLVKELRGQIIKEYGPRMVLNLANTVATYTFMKNSGIKSMLGSAGLMAVTSLHNAKVQSYGVLPMYQVLNQKPQISDVEYAQFLTAASKDAAAAGGMESPLVQALAIDYAQEGIRPGDILKEIGNGKFDERALAKVQASKDTRDAATAQGGLQQPSREAVGAHTQRELSRRQGAAQEQARG